MDLPPSKINLFDSQDYFNLSVDDYLFCDEFNLTTLEDLVLYVEKSGGENLPQNLKNAHDLLVCINQKNDIEKREDEINLLLTDDVIEIFSRKFESEVKRLDKRSENAAMLLWKKHNHNIKDVFSYLHSIDFNYRKISNIGKKSADTLELFFNSLIEDAKKIKDQDPRERNYSLFLTEVNNILHSISDVSMEWLTKKGHDYQQNRFPFSEFIQVLFQNGDLLDDRENYIFTHGTKYFHDSKMTLDQLGEKFDITRERVRQILINENFHNSIWNKIIEILQILTPQKAEMEVDFTPDEPFVSFENLDEDSLFTSHFYYQLFAKYYTKKYKPVIFEKNIYPKYLMQNDIYEGIRWVELLDTLRPLTEKRNDNEYQINLKGYLLQFIDNEELVVRNLEKRLNVLEDLIY